ncbi:MAG TPA: energy transducer TonB, partial [Paracoccaceae bacterium]|nr:energy transducer TonB [Paracoccaceae bacterium]
ETLPDLIPIETLQAEPVEPEPEEPEEPEPEIVEADDPEAEQPESEVEMEALAPVPTPRPERPELAQEPNPEPEPQEEPEPQPVPERQPDPARYLAEKPDAEPASPFASEEAPEFDSWSQAALPGADARISDHLAGGGAGSATPEAGAGGGGAPSVPGAPGNNAARSDFRAEIAAWISRHKRYPRRARAQGIEGMGVLRFAMDRSGNVLSAEVAQSSGNAELDKAILEMIRRAEPLPQIPAGLGERLEFSVPIDFALR